MASPVDVDRRTIGVSVASTLGAIAGLTARLPEVANA
jgi:hypothetical protein